MFLFIVENICCCCGFFFFKLFLLSCCMPICNLYFKLHQVKTIIYYICKVKRKSDVSGNKTDNITFMRVDRDI